MFLKNKNIIFKIRRSKVTDYAALNSDTSHLDLDHQSDCLFSQIPLYLIKYLPQLEIMADMWLRGLKNVPNIVSLSHCLEH